MFSLVSLLAAVALVSQYGFEVNASVMKRNVFNLDNAIHAVPTKRRLRNFVQIGTPPPESARLEVGQRLDLMCQAMGSPVPVVRWLKNGEPIAETDDESNELIVSHGSSVARLTSVLPVATGDNGDVYTCVATSAGKQESASTTVYVEDSAASSLLALESLLLPSAPRIISWYAEVLQELGTDVVLRCRSTGDAQHRWWRNDVPVYSDGRVKLLPSGDLAIKDIQFSDMGDYMCVAKNAHGKDSIITFLYPIKP